MLEQRIENVLSVFEKLKSIQSNSPKFKLRITVSKKKNSQFILEYVDEKDNKIIFSIQVDTTVKKIDVSVNRNSSSLLRCEFRKKLTLVTNNIPGDVTVPFLKDFAPYILK